MINFVPGSKQPRFSLGLFTTLAWSVFTGLVFVGTQSSAVYVYYQLTSGTKGIESYTDQLATVTGDGVLVSLVTISSAVVCGGLITLVVYRGGGSVREYLGLKPVPIKWLILWSFVLLGGSLLSNVIASLLEQDIVTDFVRDLYGNAGNIYLLAFAVVLAGPAFEELFFRGFLYKGLAGSRLGVAGAIVFTALVWTMIHGQYDLYVKLNIFFLGVLFGFARYKSGSILPPLVMHMLMNGLALVEVASL